MTNSIDVVQNLKDQLRMREESTESVPFTFGAAKFIAGDNNRALVEVDGNVYDLNPVAFKQVAETLEIPTPFAKRIDNELFEVNFNHQATQGVNKNNEPMNMEFRNALVVDNKIRSFVKPENPYVSAYSVLETLENTFDGDYDLKYIKLSDDKMSFSMLPNEYRNAIDGSNLFGGLNVNFSESWAVFPTLDAYIWRELCSNGMIDKLDGHKFRVSGKDEDQILEQIDFFARASVAKLPILFENFEKLLVEKVEDYKKMVARICQEYRLPNKVRERLLFWAEQPEFLMTISHQAIENMHDIVNLITYAGTHDDKITPENRQLLLEIGGNLTLKHDERCGSCGLIV